MSRRLGFVKTIPKRPLDFKLFVLKMKHFKEEFAKFSENPTREGFRELIRTHGGETNNFDFKKNFPDHPKMAKHVLAMANSVGGGCIVSGMEEKDSLEVSGADTITDKAELYTNIGKYVPNELEYEIFDYTYNDSEYNSLKGKKFQIALVNYNPKIIPLLSKKEGTGIDIHTVYIRKGTCSEKATYTDLQQLINARIETGYSSTSEIKLEEHIGELKTLYSSIDKTLSRNLFAEVNNPLSQFFNFSPNPAYPTENLEDFLSKMIEIKKKRIKQLIMER